MASLPLPDHVHGCAEGRSPWSTANVHLGSSKISSIDVKDFYPSVCHVAVFRLWRRLGFGPRLAGLLTKVTTRDLRLPQGAPTSDALANHVMAAVDRELAAIAQDLDLKLSRYLDNIDFSGERAHEAIPRAIAALRQDGFAVRHNKVFNVSRASRQVVTGYTVNNGLRPSVGRAEQRKIRSAVHELIRHRRAGLSTIRMERRLRGRLAYLRQTNRSAAQRLDRQLAAAGVELR